MTLKRRTKTFTADVAATLGLGSAYAVVRAIEVLSSVDTSVSFAVVDRDSRTIATIASADYTTRTQFNLTPLETRTVDTGGDFQIDAEGGVGGVVARSPLTITPTGIGSGTVTFEAFVEV
jgi:hypothetical protein